jgi:hypothetical protein
MNNTVWSETYSKEPVLDLLPFFRVSCRNPEGHIVTYPAIYDEQAAKDEFYAIKLSYASNPKWDNWKLERYTAYFHVHTYQGGGS